MKRVLMDEVTKLDEEILSRLKTISRRREMKKQSPSQKNIFKITLLDNIREETSSSLIDLQNITESWDKAIANCVGDGIVKAFSKEIVLEFLNKEREKAAATGDMEKELKILDFQSYLLGLYPPDAH